MMPMQQLHVVVGVVSFLLQLILCSSLRQVKVTRVNHEAPLFRTPDQSSFAFSYNPTWSGPDLDQTGLLVRCQNVTSTGGTTPSVLAHARLKSISPDYRFIEFDYLSDANIVLQP